MLVALLVCLIPTTIGGLLSAIGIAGMDRLVRRNVLALSGRAVEAAGDCSTLLLDKTGTITLGNRQATHSCRSRASRSASSPTRRSSRASPTRRPRAGRSSSSPRSATACASATVDDGTLVPFTAETRMSGVDLDGRSIRKGAADAIRRWIEAGGGTAPAELEPSSSGSRARAGRRSSSRATAARSASIQLKDVVKEGMRERFDELRAMGIRTVMITGDNPLTARRSPRRRASTTSSPRRSPRRRWR